jgi:hypothetical protein
MSYLPETLENIQPPAFFCFFASKQDLRSFTPTRLTSRYHLTNRRYKSTQSKSQEMAASDVQNTWGWGAIDGEPEQEDLPSLVGLFEPATEVACTFGDITLVVNDGFHPQLRIKVSSCTLASASKVFEVLFSKRFAEGRSIQAGNREVQVTDIPRPLLAMCQLLHHKAVDPPVTEETILDLALLVDKYDCVEPLRHAMFSIVTHLLPSKDDEWGVHQLYTRLMTAAYLVDQPGLFRSCTSELVMRSNNFGIDARCEELLPVGIVGNIQYLCTAHIFVH